MIKKLFFVAMYCALIQQASADQFAISYKWCAANSSIVVNLDKVPKETAVINFELIDIDWNHRHGGGKIIFKNQKQIPCEAIKGITGPQISTRFPDKKDRYDLSAEFVDKDGKILGKASFIRTFPE